MEINKKIGEQIREVRKKYNISMVQLTEDLEISQPRLSRIENGEQEIPISLIQKFCQRFNIPMGSFFKMIDNEDISLVDDQVEHILSTLNDEQKKALYVFLSSFQNNPPSLDPFMNSCRKADRK